MADHLDSAGKAMPKERPLLFSAPMVRALLAGTKTQTRRVLRPQPIDSMFNPPNDGEVGNIYLCPDILAPQTRVFVERTNPGCYHNMGSRAFAEKKSPYGQPGDRLWVRETWAPVDENYMPADLSQATALVYRADGLLVPNQRDMEIRAIFSCNCGAPLDSIKWRPSIFMPRIASRILLEITGVRVERLQDISEADALAEGVSAPAWCETDGRSLYRDLWEKINGDGSWDANPWVWVVEFRSTK